MRKIYLYVLAQNALEALENTEAMLACARVRVVGGAPMVDTAEALPLNVRLHEVIIAINDHEDFLAEEA